MTKFNTAIVGVGYTDYSLNSGRSVLSLAAEACQKAMDDAGLGPEDVDAVLEFNVGDSIATESVAACLALPEMNYAIDWYAGGFAPCALLATASAVIQSGMARSALIYRAMNGRSGFRLGGSGGGDTFRAREAAQYRVPYGWLTFGQNMAMWCRRHMELYGTKSEHLGAIAVSQRANALLNERAVQREELTLQEYLSSRVIVDPFHIYDMSLETDGACALLVTSMNRARDCRRKPVKVRAAAFFGKQTISDPMWADSFLWPDITENYVPIIAPRLYAEVGIGPKDIDVAEIYDCFTFTVVMGIEGLGFCRKGEGGPFAASGAIKLGGTIPVNTNGGMLSEAYVHGMNTLVEAVMQLRGECGPRQVKDAELAAVTSGATTIGSACILSL